MIDETNYFKHELHKYFTRIKTNHVGEIQFKIKINSVLSFRKNLNFIIKDPSTASCSG